MNTPNAHRPLTFDPGFGRLGREIARFANHTRRLVTVSQKLRPLLQKASDWTEGTAPLSARPESAGRAMRAIDKFARIHRENRHLLFGAYFAHHHLRMQAELSRQILRQCFTIEPSKRAAACRQLLDRAVSERREWIAALLDVSIAAAAPDLRPDDYVVFNVGALTDHEDVDLAIVVASLDAQRQFAKAFGQLSKTFLRFASKLQLFLAEQLENSRAGGLIEEYEEIVSNPNASVVVVMQLLGAQYLSGSRVLARKFQERVTDRFYAESGNALAHEGFLRAVMTELRHYRSRERAGRVLAPKREIYLPSKLVTGAMRVIYGVREAHPPRALDLLKEENARRSETYAALHDAFVENEVLRALLWLYVIKSDEIDLYDPTVAGACRRVAVLLGLGRSARRRAETRLLPYFETLRAQAMGSVLDLTVDISEHLRKVSTFRQLVERGRGLRDPRSNFAFRMLEVLRRYKGGVFWEEIVELFAGSDELTERFLTDLSATSDEEMHGAVRELVGMMCRDASALVELLIFLSHHDRKVHPAEPLGQDWSVSGEVNSPADPTLAFSSLVRSDVLSTRTLPTSCGSRRPLAFARRLSEGHSPLGPNARLFWEALLHVLAHDAAQRETFVARLDDETETEALHRLAIAFPASSLARLADFIEVQDTTTRGERVVRALRAAMILVHHHSRRTGRTARRVLERIPEFVHRVGDAERIRALSRSLTVQAAREPAPAHQVELLGDGFDVSAMGASLFAILKGAPAERDREFVGAFDAYVRELFKACVRGVIEQSPSLHGVHPTGGIAVYATGGFGRGEGFGADWDYLAVVDDDVRTRQFFGKVVQRVAAAVARRGIIPHNRLAATFNSYVVTVRELLEYLQNRTSETFIDEAEIMEARFIYGDLGVHGAFQSNVHDLVLHAHRYVFLRDILFELRERRSALPRGLHIKDGKGGLREIHLLWLAIGVFAELGATFSDGHFEAAAAALPAHRADLRFLIVAHTELRRVRDLYRLVIADDEDPTDIQALVRIARDLAPLEEIGARGAFDVQIRKLMDAAALRIDRIRDAILAEPCPEPET